MIFLECTLTSPVLFGFNVPVSVLLLPKIPWLILIITIGIFIDLYIIRYNSKNQRPNLPAVIISNLIAIIFVIFFLGFALWGIFGSGPADWTNTIDGDVVVYPYILIIPLLIHSLFFRLPGHNDYYIHNMLIHIAFYHIIALLFVFISKHVMLKISTQKNKQIKKDHSQIKLAKQTYLATIIYFIFLFALQCLIGVISGLLQVEEPILFYMDLFFDRFTSSHLYYQILGYTFLPLLFLLGPLTVCILYLSRGIRSYQPISWIVIDGILVLFVILPLTNLYYVSHKLKNLWFYKRKKQNIKEEEKTSD